MIFREAQPKDIPQIQIVRNAVKENVLSNPALVSDADCLEFIAVRGKGWVCETANQIIGFSIVDLKDENVWALFVHPDFENQGIGRKLHVLMLDWYFSNGKDYIWLGTAPNTRAETFYRRQGWIENGNNGAKELKFELTKAHYLAKFS